MEVALSKSETGETELFEILRDPGETNNLAAERADIVQSLSAEVEQWNATLPTEYVKTEEPK